jgi:amidase
MSASHHDPYHAFLPYPASDVPHAAKGPLSGLSIAVKDIFDVKGYPTGCGQPHALALSGIKAHTAPFVQLFLDAGAHFVGKTHTVELAFSLNGKNIHFGTPINPAAPDRIPGGSSSGSASATAGGQCDIGLGSDTGGSVRGPASYCGLFGLRPTHGRLPLDHTMPLAGSFDTPGWFTRDAQTFTRVADAILGSDTHALPAKPHFILATDLLEQTDPEARKLFAAAFEKMDRLVSPMEKRAVIAPDFDALFWAFRYLQGYEAWQSHGAFITRHRPSLGPGVMERFEFSSQVTDEQVATNTKIRKTFQAHLDAILGENGVIVLPTVPDVPSLLAAPESELEVQRNQSMRLLCASGLSGCPQVTIPLLTKDGAPMGISLLGPRGSDKALCHLATDIYARMRQQHA